MVFLNTAFSSTRKLGVDFMLVSIKILAKGDPIEILRVFTHFCIPQRCETASSERLTFISQHALFLFRIKPPKFLNLEVGGEDLLERYGSDEFLGFLDTLLI